MLEQISSNRSFQGFQQRYQHNSERLGCKMKFSVYVPDIIGNESFPVVYWLSGLTCTDENFTHKSGFQRIASELKIIVVAPDTSPRGECVADDDAYDLGQGAGFYLNAQQEPWRQHYHMYDYITEELPALINQHFPTNGQQAVSGHSMGGHGALSIGIKNQHNYSSISAFSPIVNPINCPWGQKAFNAYLGADTQLWDNYDSCKLLNLHGCDLPIKISQGLDDDFLVSELKPDTFIQVAKDKEIKLDYHGYKGFDHSYYFIASFMEDHLRFHAQYFNA